MNLSDLRKIGLTSGEVKVYEALLELGDCTKTALAKKSGIAPSNIYDVTNRLVGKGIISKVEKNGVAHFSPANPRHLLDFLEEKKQEIDKEREVVGSILPTLLLKFQEKLDKISVETFYGWNGMKTVFEDMLQECGVGDETYVFGASKAEQDEQADHFFVKYSKQRAEKGIKTRIIFNEELRQRKQRVGFFLKSKRYHVRFLKQTTPAEIMLYKDKTCIILLTREPLIIRITGKEAMESFRQYFEVMWKNAKK